MRAAPADSHWEKTEGLKDRLVALFTEGQLSMRELAAALSGEFNVSLTRNAVISKLRRIYGKSNDLKYRKRRKPKPKPPPKPKKPRPAKTVHFVYYPLPELAEPIGLDMPLLKLRKGMCRYPTSGYRAPYLFCGLPVENGCPYCPTHCLLTMPHRNRHDPKFA
jgi:hypothetical protein